MPVSVHPYPWRVFFLLVAGSVLSVLALLPYLSAMMAPTFAHHPLPLPLPILALIQGTVNFSIAAGFGLLLARKLGLGTPFLETWLYPNRTFLRHRILLIAPLAGLVLGVVTLLLIASPLGAELRHLTPVSESAIPLWKRLLACGYGAVGEEILMRLFPPFLVLWLFAKISRINPQSEPLFWGVNLLVAIAFGAGHLPFAASFTVLTPSLIATIISLNAFVALGFGYLYWTRGLEAAMLAHLTVDLVLHVLGPALAKG